MTIREDERALSPGNGETWRVAMFRRSPPKAQNQGRQYNPLDG